MLDAFIISNSKYIIFLWLYFTSFFTFSQQILDPCFLSPETGQFYSTPELAQVCKCRDISLSSDMLEWDGTQWLGVIDYAEVTLPPPPGCNPRAIWCGHSGWTPGGEAFALKLDKPFKAGVTYEYTFTYAKTGVGPDEPFSPILYTNSIPDFKDAVNIGRLPPSTDWKTNSIKFAATSNQATHEWLIVHAVESSGIILANCKLTETLKSPFLMSDTTICVGEQITLQAPVSRFYEYKWSTGENTSSIIVSDSGTYSLEITLPVCETIRDEISVGIADCEVYLEMPDVFTPNGDALNPIFKPIYYNYLESGSMRIYNRWGKRIFEGDLFQGWDGSSDNTETATGIYYWECVFIDKNGNTTKAKGFVNLIR